MPVSLTSPGIITQPLTDEESWLLIYSITPIIWTQGKRAIVSFEPRGGVINIIITSYSTGAVKA